MAVSLSRTTGTVAFIYWIWDGLDRTIFTSIKFSFPARFVSPFGFLGMLTFITFIILGVSGALLMFYYEPIIDRAWDSVEFINNDVPFGFHIRNIHYHGSNAMVGSGFHDFVLRFYAQHVFILPVVMLGLMAVHFPRFLVFDVPMVMAISGAILITGRVFPIDLGFKFEPTVPPGITVPEWYLTGLYAFLRTQYDKFVTGVLWPGLFILSLLLVPFIDRYKKFSWKDRPIVTAFGITGIAQIMVTTYWGFYISPDTTKPLVERLVIDPIFFYLVMVLLVPLGFGFSYMMIKLSKEAE